MRNAERLAGYETSHCLQVFHSFGQWQGSRLGFWGWDVYWITSMVAPILVMVDQVQSSTVPLFLCSCRWVRESGYWTSLWRGYPTSRKANMQSKHTNGVLVIKVLKRWGSGVVEQCKTCTKMLGASLPTTPTPRGYRWRHARSWTQWIDWLIDKIFSWQICACQMSCDGLVLLASWQV